MKTVCSWTVTDDLQIMYTRDIPESLNIFLTPVGYVVVIYSS